MTARLATRPTVVVPNPYGPTADLDAIIINYRTPQLTGRCVRSWLDYADAHLAAGIRVRLTVVDVDPDPAQPTIAHAQLAGHDVQVLVLPWNAGYSGACNRAAQLTDAPMLAFLNADTRLTNADCIPTMMQFFADHPDDAHIAGPLQVDDRGLVRHGGIFGSQEAPQHRDFGEPVTDLHRTNQRAVTVSGSAYFVRRSTWNKLRDCPLFQEQIDPGCPGAMLRTPHYFEETWCVPGDTQVWTTAGPRRADEVTAGDDVYGYREDIGEVGAGRVTHAGPTGIRPVLEFVARGRRLRVTGDHQVLVAEGVSDAGIGGQLAWRKAEEVQVGDCLVAVTGLPQPEVAAELCGDTEVPVTDALLQMMGMYVGDGCHDERSITIALPPDARVRDHYEHLASKVFTKATQWTRRGTPTVERQTGPITIQPQARSFRFSSAAAVRWLNAAGFGGLAHTKRVPSWVFTTSRDNRLAFLAGIVDSDGHVASNGTMSIRLANRGLIEDIRQLLVSCGLPASAVAHHTGQTVTFPQGHMATGMDTWSITCANPTPIPTADPLYLERMAHLVGRPTRGGAALADRLGLEDTQMAVRRITAINELGNMEVYDLTVPSLDSFVADGVVVHNCSYHGSAHRQHAWYVGEAEMEHLYDSSPHDDVADTGRLFATSKPIFTRACDIHHIRHD